MTTTTMKINPIIKEQSNNENNYALNMEILSSLKSLPGKVVNLQSDKYIFKNEEINKKVIFPGEKFTTSSSISKELFCDPFFNDTEKNHKRSYTTNSVFKPIANYPLKKSTTNYYGLNSMLSYSDFLMPNPTPFNPLKITNSSFSKNSFHPMLNPDIPLINPINSINPINTFTQINPINNPINTITSFFPNFTPLFSDQIIKKNNCMQTKNNFLLNKKRNADNDININTNTNICLNNFNNISIKENTEKEDNNNEIKENKNDCISTNIKTNKINTPKAKSTFFCIKQSKNKSENCENSFHKKNLFTVIQKSSYIYRKRKPRKKKLNGINSKKLCGHEGCEGIFKTKKQLLYHHYKMNIECHNDTISLLKMINLVKNIILKNVHTLKEDDKISNISNISDLYKETMKKISLDEHIETLVGFNFEDELDINKSNIINIK